MPKQVAVAIGVKCAGSLDELPGAVNGAREFHSWAQRAGYEAHLVTDEDKPVTIDGLKARIRAILDAGDTERLLLYFAGHGIQPTVNTAYWLVSGWEEDSDEAINVNLSLSNAKRSGIAQIGVFADACRSTVKDAATVGGRSIFPKAETSAGKGPQWDHFFASRLGEPAQEVTGAKAYGIFTRCVMAALHGEAKDAVETRVGEQPERVVTSSTLATYLEDTVPFVSGSTRGALVQNPDVHPGWRRPRDVYVGLSDVVWDDVGGTPAADGVPSPDGAPGPPGPRYLRISPDARSAVSEAARRADAGVAADEALFARSEGRGKFETRQGLSIVGAIPVDVAVRGTENVDLFPESGAWHVRGYGGIPQTALVKLSHGNWIGACIIPDFIGTVVVKEGLAASLNYLPGENGYIDRQVHARVAPVLHRWTALMAQGRFGNYDELEAAADELRKYKHGNPSLGILAAYAYERAGSIEEIDSIAWWFADMGQPVPFDVAMLSRHRIHRADGEMMVQITDRKDHAVRVAGTFPLMTQGWSFLERDDDYARPELLALRGGLLPGLWTTLREAEGMALAELVRGGFL